MVQYKSVFAPYINQMVDMKRSLGFKYTQADYILRMFDDFVIKHNITGIALPKETVDLWNAKRDNEKITNQLARISVIRQLAIFLNDLGIKAHVPRMPKQERSFTPYIFTTDEMDRFFKACDEVTIGCRQIDSCATIIPSYFRLLYSTGIRLSEALSL
jgi:integrase/recombinase XerD